MTASWQWSKVLFGAVQAKPKKPGQGQPEELQNRTGDFSSHMRSHDYPKRVHSYSPRDLNQKHICEAEVSQGPARHESTTSLSIFATPLRGSALEARNPPPLLCVAPPTAPTPPLLRGPAPIPASNSSVLRCPPLPWIARLSGYRA